MSKMRNNFLGGALLLAGAIVAVADASAESLTGRWNCVFTRGDKSTYNAIVTLTATTGQWGSQSPGTLTRSASEVTFQTRLPTGTDGNTVVLTLNGDTISARLSGAVAASAYVRGAQNYSNSGQFVNNGTCKR